MGYFKQQLIEQQEFNTFRKTPTPEQLVEYDLFMKSITRNKGLTGKQRIELLRKQRGIKKLLTEC